MRRFLKKPLDMKGKDFVEQVITMNKLLNPFPDASPTVPAAKIPNNNNITDILESEISITWQHHLVLQGFNPMDGTIAELVNFFKKVKSTKELPVVKKSSHKKTRKYHSKGGKKGAKKRNPKGESSSAYNCMLYRLNKTHNTEDC